MALHSPVHPRLSLCPEAVPAVSILRRIGRQLLGVQDLEPSGGLAFDALYPRFPPSGTAVRTYTPVRAVSASTVSAVLVPENPGRRLCTITNDSTATLYLAFSPVASTSLYIAKLGSGAMFAVEEPAAYLGPISGVWDAATGSAVIAEQS